MKEILVKLKALVYAAIIIAALWLLWIERSIIVEISFAQWETLTVIISLVILQLYLQSRNFVDLLETKVNKGKLDWLHLWAISNLSNYFAPFQPGLAVRAGVLKSWGVPVAKTTTATLKQVHLSLLSAAILMSAGMTFSPLFNFGFWPLVLLGISFTWIIVFFYAPCALPNHKRKHADEIAREKPTKQQIALILANYIISATAIYIVYNTLGAPLKIADSLLLATINTLSSLISILPANIGAQELILWQAGELSGLNPELTIILLFIFRISHIVGCLLVLLITSFLIPKKNNL